MVRFLRPPRKPVFPTRLQRFRFYVLFWKSYGLRFDIWVYDTFEIHFSVWYVSKFTIFPIQTASQSSTIYGGLCFPH
jgi:hypothetical protein